MKTIGFVGKKTGKTLYRFEMYEEEFKDLMETCDIKYCENEAVDLDLCEEHLEFYYCECGQRLEDSYGQPGDGFCVMCR